MLDDPENWKTLWCLKENFKFVISLMHQQGGEKAVFWVCIIRNELGGSWKVVTGVKMTCSAYNEFIKAAAQT